MVDLSNLFQRLEDMNLTAKQMSNATGISSGNISDWKNGRSMPTAPKLIAVADYLGCSIDFLLGRTTYPLADVKINSSEDEEWLSLVHRLPPEARQSFKDKIEGYLMRLEEESVVAEEIPLKEAK